jgi:hypothetical protein
MNHQIAYCWYWRDVVLSNASLWVDIDIYHPASEVFVSRSAMYLLRLSDWDFLDEFANERTDFGWPPNHFDHIEGLVLRCGPQTIARFPPTLDGTFSRLSLLNTKLPSDKTWETLPVFGGSAPNLAALLLFMVSVDVDLWSNSTHLCSVADFFDLDEFRCSAAQLLALLRSQIAHPWRTWRRQPGRW